MRKLMGIAVMLFFAIPLIAQHPGKDWKLGVALWTFHTENFPDALKLVNSTGLKYIEPNTFHSAGPEFKDSVIGQLSDEGLNKVIQLVNHHGLHVHSMYVAGGNTLESWKKEFEIAKRFGVKFVTGEPPTNMWDSIDSLAGVFGIKVAIHDHWRENSAYWHPDSVLAAIKGHPNFGACADIGHWPKSGVEPVEGIKKLAGHIIGVHLKDIAAFNDPSLKDVTIGTGVVNIPGVLDELKRQNFKGYIYIERDEEDKPNNLQSVLQSLKYYYSLIQ